MAVEHFNKWTSPHQPSRASGWEYASRLRKRYPTWAGTHSVACTSGARRYKRTIIENVLIHNIANDKRQDQEPNIKPHLPRWRAQRREWRHIGIPSTPTAVLGLSRCITDCLAINGNMVWSLLSWCTPSHPPIALKHGKSELSGLSDAQEQTV